ncbi:MAG TPA: TIGR02588 family protein [Longimicrobiaceae bacterium]|nr:TIGR02588 family protein [Longimicrobiaceae bacterium]
MADRRKERRDEDEGGGRDDSREGGPEDSIPFWEWVAAAVGAVLVIGSIGFMLYEAVAGDDSPPAIAIQVDSILPVESGYLVMIRTRNEGGSTAAGVTVEGELKGDTGKIETSETTVDYVPPHSERHGGLFFTQDPRRYTLELRAKGYQEP